jgi:hypothetical protein
MSLLNEASRQGQRVATWFFDPDSHKSINATCTTPVTRCCARAS